MLFSSIYSCTAVGFLGAEHCLEERCFVFLCVSATELFPDILLSVLVALWCYDYSRQMDTVRVVRKFKTNQPQSDQQG